VALPLSDGGLWKLRGADVASVAYQASAVLDSPLREEDPTEPGPGAPVSAAVPDSKSGGGRLIPLDRDLGLDDPQVVSSRLQTHLSHVFPNNRWKAYLALPAPERLVEVRLGFKSWTVWVGGGDSGIPVPFCWSGMCPEFFRSVSFVL
jgi:hypothetical protein